MAWRTRKGLVCVGFGVRQPFGLLLNERGRFWSSNQAQLLPGLVLKPSQQARG